MRSILPLLAFGFAAASPVLAAEIIPVAKFRQVELHGGGQVLLRPGLVQRVTLTRGSSRFTTFRLGRNGSLKIDACNASCPRNYDLQIVIETPRIEGVAVNGGGTIEAAAGFAVHDSLSAAVNGGGKIDVRQLPVATVSAAVNGGGEVLVRPRSSLSAAVRGGGEILYSGNPHVSMAVVGGGEVRRIK